MHAEELIRNLLEAHNFKVTKIQEQDHETPDFLVEGKRETYLVECKGRHDDKGELEKKRKTLMSGEAYSEAISTLRESTASERIRKAASQLKEGPSDVNFRLIWYHAFGEHAELKAKQIISSLYGTVDLMDWGNGDEYLRPCYYFDFSGFFRMRDQLDGAVVSFANSGVFCLNDHSEKYKKLKSSELCAIFGNAIRDAIEEERLGEAYIADTDVDRSNKEEVTAYLNQKYGTEFLDINITHHFASVMVNHGGDNMGEKERGRLKPMAKARKTKLMKVAGLIADEDLSWLADYPRELIDRIRAGLAAGCQGLMEKSNPRRRYLGYAKGVASDAAYIYFQKKGLVIDVRVDADRIDEVSALGIEVRPRENYQWQAGWLTGVRVPYEADLSGAVVGLILEALGGRG